MTMCRCSTHLPPQTNILKMGKVILIGKNNETLHQFDSGGVRIEEGDMLWLDSRYNNPVYYRVSAVVLDINNHELVQKCIVEN